MHLCSNCLIVWHLLVAFLLKFTTFQSQGQSVRLNHNAGLVHQRQHVSSTAASIRAYSILYSCVLFFSSFFYFAFTTHKNDIDKHQKRKRRNPCWPSHRKVQWQNHPHCSWRTRQVIYTQKLSELSQGLMDTFFADKGYMHRTQRWTLSDCFGREIANHFISLRSKRPWRERGRV